MPVAFREVRRGDHVAVYLEVEDFDPARLAFADRVIALIETELQPQFEALLGAWDDVDGDGRLSIVVSERVATGSPTLSAFVRAVDFDPAAEAPWSNHADILYLDPSTAPAALSAILTHELAHVAQFTQWRSQFGHAPWPLPDWLLEGQAHAAEFAISGSMANLQDRLKAFTCRPEACPLVIGNAAAAGRWREPGSRGATASFALWLTERFGKNWWRRLSELAAEEDGWQTVFGSSFHDLYREWTVSLAARGAVRPHRVELNQSLCLTVHGTATAYCRLPSGNGLKVRVQGDSTPLQVTVVRETHRSEDRHPQTLTAQIAAPALHP